MKIKKVILYSLLLLLYSTVCNSQIIDSLIIKKKSLCYYVENVEEVHSVIYEIHNKSCTTFYLWLEKNIHSSESEKIKDYFKKLNGDMSLYQMAMEINITYGNPSLFSTFLRKIKPQERFSFQIISMEVISEFKKKQIFEYLDKHTVVVNENMLEQHLKGLSNFNSLIFYKNDFITIPIYLIDI